MASVPAAQRTETIVLTQSYQQAAALDLLRPASGVTMPVVYSGHNGFWFWGPPPESATDAIVIGNFSPADLAIGYAHCELAGTVQTPPGALVSPLAAGRELRLTVAMDDLITP